jgi:quercetin dioxygenase-like cupin family protein
VPTNTGPGMNVETSHGVLCRELDARPLMENEELALVYFESDKLLFATSFLPPGTSSNLDSGHPGAHEVAFCTAGEVVLELGEARERSVRLTAGDAFLIEEGVPHTVYNAGREQAAMVWAVAPGLGRPLIPGAPS